MLPNSMLTTTIPFIANSPTLQVLTVAQFLQLAQPAQSPLWISHIPQMGDLEKIMAQVQGWLCPDEYSLTLITDITGTPHSRSVSVGAWREQVKPDALPCQLYLPPPPDPTWTALQGLIAVVAQLRHPQGGCPWDLAQTPTSLMPYVIEEAYEVVDALRQGDPKLIADELGDLLLQVVLQAQIASETGQFSLQEVAEGIQAKLIRRHPHVFGALEVADVAEVHRNWEQIKAAERGESAELPPPLSQKLQRYARTMPPMLASLKISAKASGVGLDWPDIEGVWAKFAEELAEFRAALQTDDRDHQQAELGDLLFTVITLARWYELDPTAGLQGTLARFVQRLEQIEAQIDRPLESYSLEELEQFWQRAKATLGQ
jgi:XTP/dITP diphosphohydrolase